MRVYLTGARQLPFTSMMSLLGAMFLFPIVLGGTELLKNPDFENSNFTYWQGYYASISPTSDAYQGHTAVKVTRGGVTGALEQHVTGLVKAGHHYYFRAYVKLLSKGHPMIHSISPVFSVEDNFDPRNTKRNDQELGARRYLQTDQWHLVGGDVYVPQMNISDARVYIDLQTDRESIDFIVDSASLQEVPRLLGFPAEANRDIDRIRKADLTIKLDANSIAPDGLEIEVIETSGLFGFGSVVNASAFMDPANKPYQDFFFKNFNWAVMNDLQWINMEPQRGQIDNIAVTKAIDVLKHKGINIRGNNIFSEQYYPKWVTTLSSQDLKTAMGQRLCDVVGQFKDKLDQWGVDDDSVFFSHLVDQSGDQNLTMWMFRETHKIDPNPLLFLTDDSIVGNYASSNVAMEDKVLHYRAADVPVGGIGIRSHIMKSMDLSVIKAQLDEVAKAGLPLWITELMVVQVKEEDRPQMLEDLLRLFFSHPAVHGINLWSYWDQLQQMPINWHSPLCTGQNCTLNESGKRVSHLLQTEWRTNETHPIHKGQTIHIRGFKGHYNLRVKHNKHVIHERSFYLGYKGKRINLSLSGSNSNPQVNKFIIG